MVEVSFGIIEKQAIHRGSLRSVSELIIKIWQIITGWNQRPSQGLGKECLE